VVNVGKGLTKVTKVIKHN